MTLIHFLKFGNQKDFNLQGGKAGHFPMRTSVSNGFLAAGYVLRRQIKKSLEIVFLYVNFNSPSGWKETSQQKQHAQRVPLSCRSHQLIFLLIWYAFVS